MELPTQPWYLDSGNAESRDALMRFWLAAPSDRLQQLWDGEFGSRTRSLVQQLNSQSQFNPDQLRLRDSLNQSIQRLGLSHPMGQQLLVAAFLLSPPGLFKVANPEQQLPDWLTQAYRSLYEAASPAQAPASTPALPKPDFGAFPGSLAELVGHRIQLNRLLGLSNLYYIDPDDREIASELIELRHSLAQLVASAPPHDLERIWATDFGDRYWALVRSGIQNEPRSPRDQQVLDQSSQLLSVHSFNHSHSINALLVVMMYLKPGSMRVEGAIQKLPQWLLPTYQQVFELVAPASA
ncbi:hypothetical protein [Synechococcus sp. LTW-G]